MKTAGNHACVGKAIYINLKYTKSFTFCTNTEKLYILMTIEWLWVLGEKGLEVDLEIKEEGCLGG